MLLHIAKPPKVWPSCAQVQLAQSDPGAIFAMNDSKCEAGSDPLAQKAAIKAVESADDGLGDIIPAIEQVGGVLLVMADHGNCEQEWDFELNVPHTAHTTNLVPCVLFGQGTESAHLRNGGRLGDIAPTLLDLMKVPQPAAMTGQSLLGGSEPVMQNVAGVEIRSLGDKLQFALSGRVNTALTEAEVLAGLAELETRLNEAKQSG